MFTILIESTKSIYKIPKKKKNRNTFYISKTIKMMLTQYAKLFHIERPKQISM